MDKYKFVPHKLKLLGNYIRTRTCQNTPLSYTQCNHIEQVSFTSSKLTMYFLQFGQVDSYSLTTSLGNFYGKHGHKISSLLLPLV